MRESSREDQYLVRRRVRRVCRYEVFEVPLDRGTLVERVALWLSRCVVDRTVEFRELTELRDAGCPSIRIAFG